MSKTPFIAFLNKRAESVLSHHHLPVLKLNLKKKKVCDTSGYIMKPLFYEQRVSSVLCTPSSNPELKNNL